MDLSLTGGFMPQMFVLDKILTRLKRVRAVYLLAEGLVVPECFFNVFVRTEKILSGVEWGCQR